MFLKEEQIIEYVNKLGLEAESQSSIWGTVKPSTLSGAVFGAVAVLDLKYNVLHFTKSEIVIISISNSTGKIIDDQHLIIPRSEITEFGFKKKMMGYNCTIKTANGQINMKVNSKMIGAKWHQVNLQHVLKVIESAN